MAEPLPAAVPATIGRAELAGLLGLSGLNRETLRKRLGRLQAAHGFPRPLPGLSVWSRDLVTAWIAGNGAPSGPGGAAARGASLVELAARLEARCARVA